MATTRTRKSAVTAVVPGPDYVAPEGITTAEAEPTADPETGPEQEPHTSTPASFRKALTAEQIGALMSPLNPNRVSQRDVGGRSLSYVEAYDIKATLTRVFGFGGFSADVLEAKILDIRDGGRQGTYPDGHSKAGQHKTPYVLAYALVRLTIHNIGPAGQDVTYTEAAVGSNDGWTIGDVADNAIKTAESDALKRCATYLGTQFGLSLYRNGSRSDVVGTLLDPEQSELFRQWRAERVTRRNEAAESQIAHSLGAEDMPKGVEDVVENVP